MTPSLGDIIRLLIVFELGNGVEMINVFTAILTSLSTSDWDDILNEAKDFMNDVFSPWESVMSPSTQSSELRLSVRDTALHQWNEMSQDVFTDILGTQPGTVIPFPNTGSIVAYTELPRHRGRKGLPPPAEDGCEFGLLNAASLASLLTVAAEYVIPFAGTLAGWNNGILTEVTETFRPFTGSVAFSDVMGTQVTRKIGRGM